MAILFITGVLLFLLLLYRVVFVKNTKHSNLLNISLIFVIVFFTFLGLTLIDVLNTLDKSESYTEIGPFGDYVGGIVNPLISVFAIFAAGFAFYAQYQANRQVQEQFEKQEDREYKTNFEAKFFELIKIHRENVSEQNYTKYGNSKMEMGVGRKVFRLLSKELEECLKEVFRYRKIYEEEFITPTYKVRLNEIKTNNNLKIDIETLALIDLSYILFFFGVARDSEDYILNNFKGKYDYQYFKRLIKFLQLKPKKENTIEYKNWEKFYSLPTNEMKLIIDEIYTNRDVKDYNYLLNGYIFTKNYDLNKYYGGQQHRLGHYFRHLFQTYKFLYCEKKLNSVEKYFYAKTLRAQISTYEQTIFFINSLSSLGYNWELIPERNAETGENMLLITNYHIIKNLPGDKFLDIIYEDYYPNVDYEFKKNK